MIHASTSNRFAGSRSRKSDRPLVAAGSPPLGRRALANLPALRPISRKRSLDVVVAAAVLLLLSPVIGVISLLIKSDGGPVLFRQRRVGYAGREFGMLKFRSMAVDAEKRLAEVMKLNEKASGITFKIKNDPRVTRVGRICAKPPLMSSRSFGTSCAAKCRSSGRVPPFPAKSRNTTCAIATAFSPSPGSRASGRSANGIEACSKSAIGMKSTFPSRFSSTFRYIEEQSFLHDLRILVKTIPAVLFGS